MENRIAILALTTSLAACGTGGEPRYKDNGSLERPPEVPMHTTAAGQDAFNEPEPPKRRYRKGLDSDVYRVESAPHQMSIKRDFEESWSLVGQAIQLRDLKLADQDRSKGNFYVVYDGGSLLGRYSPFTDDLKSTYLIRLENENNETKVSVSFAGKEEQSPTGGFKSGIDDVPDDLSEKLLDLLFKTLRDDVKQD